MAKKFNYDSEALLNIKFSPSNPGYDADEVDDVFDKMIKDYDSFNELCSELSKQKELEEEKYKSLKEDYDRLEFELASVKKQLALLKKTSGITDDNYHLVMKVNAYERVLHRRGIDLKKALSDPDNC